jgi:hypothetical protein
MTPGAVKIRLNREDDRRALRALASSMPVQTDRLVSNHCRRYRFAADSSASLGMTNKEKHRKRINRYG